jgi:hypothetical protein
MSFQNEKQLLRQSLYSRMRITSKTVHDINKMEDNFALRYVFTYPGIISRAELVPSHGASRRRLGDKNFRDNCSFKFVANRPLAKLCWLFISHYTTLTA